MEQIQEYLGRVDDSANESLKTLQEVGETLQRLTRGIGLVLSDKYSAQRAPTERDSELDDWLQKNM